MFSTVIAPTGQDFSHFLHPIHPALHLSFTSLPLSLELQSTTTSCLAGFFFINPFGHISIHFPQRTHFSSSTTATPSTTDNAPNAQTDTVHLVHYQ